MVPHGEPGRAVRRAGRAALDQDDGSSSAGRKHGWGVAFGIGVWTMVRGVLGTQTDDLELTERCIPWKKTERLRESQFHGSCIDTCNSPGSVQTASSTRVDVLLFRFHVNLFNHKLMRDLTDFFTILPDAPWNAHVDPWNHLFYNKGNLLMGPRCFVLGVFGLLLWVAAARGRSPGRPRTPLEALAHRGSHGRRGWMLDAPNWMR